MTFQNPQLLILSIFLIPVGYSIWKGSRKTKRTLEAFSEDTSYIRKRLFTKLILSLTFLASILIVAGGPQRYIIKPGEVQAGNFVFLVDVSRSMAARNDCDGSMPLEYAKSLMTDIVSEIPVAGFAFLAFSELSFPLSEVSFDRQYLREIIDNGIYTEVVPVPGSDVGNALFVLIEKKIQQPKLYENVENVILLSDGDFSEEVRQNMIEVIPDLRDADIKVISIGIGTEAPKPIPTLDDNQECIEGQFERSGGKEFYTNLYDEPLRFIAEETGGRYFHESDRNEIFEFLRSQLKITPGLEPPVQTEDISALFLLIATISFLGLVWIQRL